MMILDDDDRSEGADPAGGGAVLRRLIRARNSKRVGDGAAPSMPQTVVPTPARGGATAAARSAEKLYGLPVQPLSVRPGGATVAELAELLPMPALYAVVQGPSDAIGVVALCPAAVTALIEAQALGRVTARPMERRPITASDAMISADYVDRLLVELQAEVASLDGFECFAGYHYASHLDDVRPLLLLFEDVPFRTLDMTLSFGGRDRREGRIFVGMPQRSVAALPAPRSAQVGGPTQGKQPASATAGRNGGGSGQTAAVAADPGRPDLSQAVRNAPVEIVGILCRRQMTLGQLRGLVPGATITLPRVSLMDARLETASGQVLAQGKLGEADGCFAIRMQDPVTALTAGSVDADPWTSPVAQPAAAASVATGLPAGLRAAALSDAHAEPPIGDFGQPVKFRRPVGNAPAATEQHTALIDPASPSTARRA